MPCAPWRMPHRRHARQAASTRAWCAACRCTSRRSTQCGGPQLHWHLHPRLPPRLRRLWHGHLRLRLRRRLRLLRLRLPLLLLLCLPPRLRQRRGHLHLRLRLCRGRLHLRRGRQKQCPRLHSRRHVLSLPAERGRAFCRSTRASSRCTWTRILSVRSRWAAHRPTTTDTIRGATPNACHHVLAAKTAESWSTVVACG